MNNTIEQPRYYCALGGQQTVLGIHRAVPIVHGGPGCSQKLFGGLSFGSGYQGSGYAGGNAIPCTNTGEREVILGGEQRLREVIEGAVEVMDADLFVVLTGCTADIVGDDTGSIVAEYRRKGVPIVHAQTAGFKGSSFQGHDLVLSAIAEQYLEQSDASDHSLVNIFSSIPYQDSFWRGNLEALADLIAGLGLKPNILFGRRAGGAEALRIIPRAGFNLVLSPWVGLGTAKVLEERFGTPFLHYPTFPIGAIETGAFLRTLGAYAGIPMAGVETYIAEQEQRFYSYFEGLADFILEFRYDLPGHFFTVTDSLYALAVSRFLVGELSMTPGKQIVTDNPPEHARAGIRASLASMRVPSEPIFSTDGGEAEGHIRAANPGPQPLIIGSSWDKDAAERLGAYHLSLTLPVTDRVVLDRSYFGYSGGLRLTEDIFAEVLGSYE